MGAGIAELAAAVGEVVLYDPDPDAPGTTDLTELAGCDLVIEAAPESLELKRELFAAVAEIVGPDAVLATNTSSLSVTEIAAKVPHPERVVGLHFFNPPQKMRLVEVVAGAHSSDHALARAREAGEAMGKTAVDAADVAGFLVNRANRPFSLESLKLLEERVAEPAAIDRAMVLGAGFPMGPFALMDLVGIDVNHAVAESFQRQSYGEPRYRPSPLAARKVAAGDLGRKTGRGWYEYPRPKPLFPEPPEPTRDGDLAALALQAGLTTRFHHLPGARLVEVVRDTLTDEFEALATSLGMLVEPCEVDAPGLITGRVVCQLINEACFLVGAGHGTAEDVDLGMTLGLNHPKGPFARLRELGPERVVGTLDALYAELGEERYRVAPALRRGTPAGRTG